MKFSFIIPIYNCEKYLETCIQSIKDIRLKEYEIILVDDGSEDNSGTICDEFVQGNEAIRCIHQSNQGVSDARNRGLEIANGDYILFVDADDIIVPEKYRYVLKRIEIEPCIDMVVFGHEFDYYYNGNCYQRDILNMPLVGMRNSCDWIQSFEDLFYTNSLSPIWNKIFRRNFLVENELYLREDMFVYEDLEYSLRCMACCDNILFEPEIIYHYRQSEDEGNVGRRLEKIKHIPMIIEQIEDALNDMMEKQHAGNRQDEIEKILLSLYIVLAKEKITVSNIREISDICDDFTGWYHTREYFVQREDSFTNNLLKRKIVKLILRRTYNSIRHKIAVKVKNTIIYQKWKG